MKDFVSWLVIVPLLFRLTAAGQLSPALQISNVENDTVLSAKLPAAWPFALQTTTSLLHPTVWTDLAFSNITNSDFGFTNSAMDQPQQFFRLAPVLPIFQFAIFYNPDLESTFAQSFTVTGPVFSNGGIWTGSTLITFDSTVSAVGLATNTANDPFCTGYSGSGLANYIVPGQPVSETAPLNFTGAGTNYTTAAARSMLDLPPPDFAIGTFAAYSPTGLVYLANAADLYLTNSLTGTNCAPRAYPKGTNMVLFYQDASNVPPLSFVPYDFYLVTDRTAHVIFSTDNVSSISPTNIWYAGYSFITNKFFYDWREGWNNSAGPPKVVQAVQIDIRKFNVWLTNTADHNGGSPFNNLCKQSSHKGHPIDSIYVYNAVPLIGTTLPAVRVINGSMLPTQTAPYGFTLATPMPLYVYGNYNVSNSVGSSLGKNTTAYTWPAALMADSISVLSGSWNDGVTNKRPTASDTTVNAACIAGIVPSQSSYSLTTGIGYSGGVENFLRLLETWGATGDLWFNGSIVCLFPSQYATNCWVQTGSYYAAPTRHWAFDTNFVRWSGLPPLTPTVVNHLTP